MTEQEPELGGNETLPVAQGAQRVLSHAERVAANFAEGTVHREVALYHDHIEDNLGSVPRGIIAHVRVLTRGIEESYWEYIERVRASGDEVAITVKVADLHDNLARSRGGFDGYMSANRAKRYERALTLLTGSTTSASGATEKKPAPQGSPS